MKENKEIRTLGYSALIRTIRAMATTAIAVIGTSQLIEQVSWMAVLSASAMAGVLTVLAAAAGLPEVNEEEEE